MSAKRKSAPSVARGTTVTKAREIISTCQIKTDTGTPVTWTAFRQVGAAPSAPPDCYLCTLPDNTTDELPSEYNLRAIAAQGRAFTIDLKVLDRHVVYLVSKGTGIQKVPVARGETYVVPARGTGADATTVTLTFDGDTCTIEAVPNRPKTKTAPEEEPGTVMPMSGDNTPPPPLPGEDGYN